MAKVEYLVLTPEQLTYHQEDENILVEQLTPVMEKLRDQYASQGWKGIVHPRTGAEHAVREFELVKVEDGWVAFSLVEPWFTTEHILTEEFIVDVPVPVAVALLEFLASKAKATRLMVGTRAAPNGRHFGLAKIYSQYGLVPSTIELTKEIDL